jgi:hypothetical protein
MVKSRRLGRFFDAPLLGKEELVFTSCRNDDSEGNVGVIGGQPLRNAKSRAEDADVCWETARGDLLRS